MKEKRLSKLICLDRVSIFILQLSLVVVLHSIAAVTGHGGFKNLNPYVIALIAASVIAIFCTALSLLARRYMKNHTEEEKAGDYYFEYIGHNMTKVTRTMYAAFMVALAVTALISGLLMKDTLLTGKGFIETMSNLSNPLCIALYTALAILAIVSLMHTIKNIVAPEKDKTYVLVLPNDKFKTIVESRKEESSAGVEHDFTTLGELRCDNSTSKIKIFSIQGYESQLKSYMG